MAVGKGLKLFSGNGNRPLAERTASYLGIELGQVEVGRFKDDEVRVAYQDDLRGQDVFIVQPTSQPETNLKEAKLMADAARGGSAARVTLVCPYFGYGRQDRKDQPRVSIAASMVAREIMDAGVQHLLGLDFHAPQIQGFFDNKWTIVDHLFGRPVFVSLFRHLGLTDVMNGPPDLGRAQLAEAYHKRLAGGMFFAIKQKEGEDAESVQIIGQVADQRVRILDDELSTGRTMRLAADALKMAGATEIHGVAVHGKFVADAPERMAESPITTLFIGDSVIIPERTVSLLGDRLRRVTFAPLLGEAIKHLHQEESVSVLFDDNYVAGIYRGAYFI